MDPKKRKKVLDFKVPSDRRELRGILGVVIFLSKFCPELASWSGTLSECHGVTTGPPKGTCTIQNDPRICYSCLRNT